jgi:hypothetical protein
MESMMIAANHCSDLEVHLARAKDTLLEFRMKCSSANARSKEWVKSQLGDDPVRRSLSRARAEAARCEAALAFRDAEAAMARAIELWSSVAANYQMAPVLDACPE